MCWNPIGYQPQYVGTGSQGQVKKPVSMILAHETIG
jgi:hypothetical protein